MASKSSNGISPKSEFIVPPDAKIFYPTEEEFKDPFEYISKIRPLGEETGICKVIPPQSWKSPFSLDIDKFKFSARLQKLNLLDGKNRVKINFLNQLYQFWELQGIPLTIPEIEGKLLDIHNLYKLTCKEDLTAKKHVWKNLTEQLGFTADESTVLIVKETFEHSLQPFKVFNELCEGSSVINTPKPEVKKADSEDIILLLDDKDDAIESKSEIETISLVDDSDDDCIVQVIEVEQPRITRELKRLLFLGAGPKMQESSSLKRRRSNNIKYDETVESTCCSCGKVGDESSILICKGCKDKYHFTCIKPSLVSLPKRNWNCFKCTALELSKPTNDFGFEQTKGESTLFEFSEMADKFKSDHFHQSSYLVSHEDVEKEYWNLISNIDSDVVVKYGADLHAVDNGSGFPTKACANLQPGDIEYVDSGWNLNNLPILKNSLLRYINSDCSGMKIPWLYVGMCFATFCWHNEDHWLCSINYVHWGDSKIWYAIPGKDAEAFENVMKRESPELFESQPDLLHQLVTVMNPNILMQADVPVYKVKQNEGEFVITFPRAYHMGFNQGFNFAEAVNFAPIEWFNMGRESVINYAQLKRFCVFSHDELLCAIASSANKLNPTLASTVLSDLKYVIAQEENLRKAALDSGVSSSERTELEILPDDRRQCEKCKTTCFLSALTCKCNSEVLVCLEDAGDLCKCENTNRVLKFRYTVEELKLFLTNIQSVCDRYNKWLSKVESILNQNCSAVISEVRDLLKEADDRDYPECRLRKALIKLTEF